MEKVYYLLKNKLKTQINEIHKGLMTLGTKKEKSKIVLKIEEELNNIGKSDKVFENSSCTVY